MKKYFIVLPILFNTLGGITIDIPFDNIDYHIEQVNGFDRICMARPVIISGKPGSPETPGCMFNYLIPAGMMVRDIEVIEQTWRALPGRFNVYPIQPETSLETLRVFIPPDPMAYANTVTFPENPIAGFRCGNMRGFQILQIMVCPFRYNPNTEKLYVLEKLTVSAGNEHKPIGMTPQRTTSLSNDVFSNFLYNFVENKSAVWDPVYRPLCRIEDNPYDSLPTDLPSLLGPPVDFIIITDNAQSSVYEGFAQFKKQLGINTVVKTISWIRQNYSGVDDAEKTRNFIKDAVDKWGTAFVLLGGDTQLVPTRFIWVDRTVIYSQLWLPIASDLYYADLDGDWNFDGDWKYGELADSIDFYPEVFVGRIPTKTGIEAQSYVDKISDYLFPINRDIQIKALFYSSNLDNNWPGLPYAYELGSHLPRHFAKSYLDETLNNLTLQTLKDSIDAGFNIITGVGHGDVNNICVHFVWPRIFATNYYLDSLANAPRYGLMVVVTCYTNPFQSDCFGKHWILSPNGGGIGYIGPTSSSEGSIHKEYMKLVFDRLPTGMISQALAAAKANFIGCAQSNNWHRVHQFSISFLGDPTLALWQNIPRDFGSLTIQPDSLHVGLDTLSIDPGIVNSRVVDIVLYKEGECFVRDSISGGVLTVGVRTESAGYLKYAVIADGYISYIDSVLVVPVEPCVVFNSCQVVDTLGNADG
ncbi:MAG: C25 family cysteine peptidase, partial [bacterium]